MELRRRYSVRFKIDADDFESFCVALREIYLELDTERAGRLDTIDMVMAGRSHSYVVFGTQKPDITPEVYRRMLEAYVSEQVAAKTEKK